MNRDKKETGNPDGRKARGNERSNIMRKAAGCADGKAAGRMRETSSGGWQEVLARVEYGNRVLERIEERICELSGRAAPERSSGEMAIRVGGVRYEQFRLALRLKGEMPSFSMFRIAQLVMERMPARNGEAGYPDWRSLYRYMKAMNRRYGCFG